MAELTAERVEMLLKAIRLEASVSHDAVELGQYITALQSRITKLESGIERGNPDLNATDYWLGLSTIEKLEIMTGARNAAERHRVRVETESGEAVRELRYALHVAEPFICGAIPRPSDDEKSKSEMSEYDAMYRVVFAAITKYPHQPTQEVKG